MFQKFRGGRSRKDNRSKHVQNVPRLQDVFIISGVGVHNFFDKICVAVDGTSFPMDGFTDFGWEIIAESAAC